MLREPSYLEDQLNEDRERGKNPKVLGKILPFIRPYPKSLILSVLTIFTASLLEHRVLANC